MKKPGFTPLSVPVTSCKQQSCTQGCKGTRGQQCRAGEVAQPLPPALSAALWDDMASSGARQAAVFADFLFFTPCRAVPSPVPLPCWDSWALHHKNAALSSCWRCLWWGPKRKGFLPLLAWTAWFGSSFSWYCHCWEFWAARWPKVLLKIQCFGLEYPDLTLHLWVTWIWLNWIQCL